MDSPSITCPQCGRTSYNPNDVEQRYCGACHQYIGDMIVKGSATIGQYADYLDTGLIPLPEGLTPEQVLDLFNVLLKVAHDPKKLEAFKAVVRELGTRTDIDESTHS
jgi:hypothetical protein